MNACIIPAVDATPEERMEYLACRARSISYQTAELSVALDRMGRFACAKSTRAITTKLTELEKSIKSTYEVLPKT